MVVEEVEVVEERVEKRSDVVEGDADAAADEDEAIILLLKAALPRATCAVHLFS